MARDSDVVNHSHSAINARYVAHSGELGPPDDKFLPDSAEAAFAQSATLDAARERLNEECRRLQHHLREVTGNWEASREMRETYAAQRTLATNALHAIEQELTQHSRASIVKAYQESANAELAYQRMKDLCEHQETQIKHDKGCLAALDLALQAMTDATFLTEPQSMGMPALPSSQMLAAQLPATINERRNLPSTQLVDLELLLAAREYERHALARTIDDRVRFPLLDAVLQAEICEDASRKNPDYAAEVARELRLHISEALRETNIFIFELEPTLLSELGLAGTLHRYMQDLVSSRHAPLIVRITGRERSCHIAIQRAIFRAAREAVHNALQHSHASHIVVALTYSEDAVILSVEDDGEGFDVDAVMERARRGFHTGLGQLRIEAELIGARLGVKSAPGEPTRIDYIVPNVDFERD
jgi:two-component system sensor histidine kinase DegS